MFKAIKDSNCIKRISDNATIPPDSGNSDYQEFTVWIAQGNTIEPFDPPTQEQLEAQAQAEADAADKDTVKVAQVIKYLLEHTGQNCANYVHAQVNSSAVTDLASAKDALGKLENIVAELARGLSIIAKQNLR